MVGRKPTPKDFYFWSRQLKRRSMLAAITFRVPNDEIVPRPALQRERRLLLRCTSLILAHTEHPRCRHNRVRNLEVHLTR